MTASFNDNTDAKLARGLGWASIGIGLLEIAAPVQVESMLGLEDHREHRGIFRVLGAREIMQGVGILTGRQPTRHMSAGVWARVAGDILDTTLLGAAALKTRRPASFTAVAASVIAIGALDLYCALRLQRQSAR